MYVLSVWNVKVLENAKKKYFIYNVITNYRILFTIITLRDSSLRLVPGPGVPVLSPDAAEPPYPGHEPAPALSAPALVVTVQRVVRAVSGGRGVGHRAHTRALQQQQWGGALQQQQQQQCG